MKLKKDIEQLISLRKQYEEHVNQINNIVYSDMELRFNDNRFYPHKNAAERLRFVCAASRLDDLNQIKTKLMLLGIDDFEGLEIPQDLQEKIKAGGV